MKAKQPKASFDADAIKKLRRQGRRLKQLGEGVLRHRKNDANFKLYLAEIECIYRQIDRLVKIDT